MAFNVQSLLSTGIGSILDGASKIIGDFKADPTKVAEAEKALAELRINATLKSQELSNQLEAEYTKQLDIVNKTMQTEAYSEHWIVYSWRPTIAFTFCIMILNNYVAYPYLHNYGAVLLDIPQSVIITIGSILGVNVIGRTMEKLGK